MRGGEIRSILNFLSSGYQKASWRRARSWSVFTVDVEDVLDNSQLEDFDNSNRSNSFQDKMLIVIVHLALVAQLFAHLANAHS